MCVFEIRPRLCGWRLAPEGEFEGLDFVSLEAAERRARWLAMRQEVRGVSTEIKILDQSGALVGAWRGERYASAMNLRTLDRVA